MSPMRGGRVAAGMLIATTAIGLLNGTTHSIQATATATTFPQRSQPSPQSPGQATVVVIVTLADAPVEAVVVQAAAAGLSDPQIFAAATLQALRVADAQTQLIQILTQPPFDAQVIDQSIRRENTITIRVNAERVPGIQDLPGVLSVRVGETAAPPERTPSRLSIQPGTRVPPQPPGYNQDS